MHLSIPIYDYIFKELSDPRVYHWPLMSDPWGFLGIVAIYVYAIFQFLPRYMQDRKPFNLKYVIALYNIFQMVACTSLAHGILTSGWTTYYSLGCQPVDYSETKIALKMANLMWWHMMLKLTEFIETVFFLLRKKQSQVSGLHVYHHISTFYFAWFSAKYVPGGMISFTVIVNSIVHIIMYGYYFMSSFGPRVQKKLANLKPKITAIQLIQLVIIFLHTLQALDRNCNVPTVVPYTYLPNIFINISLFISFYRKSYRRQRQLVKQS